MSEIIKFDLFDNTQEKFVIINTTKQQLAFFPKEESQMFQGKNYDNLGTRPVGYENDPTTETENGDTRAFVNSIKTTDIDPFATPTTYRTAFFDTQKIPFTGDVTLASQLMQLYRYGMDDVNSSHTPTDYIGATTFNIPYLLNELFANFQFLSESADTLTDLYSTTDSSAKVSTVINGIQRLRIPINVFNTILTDEASIENNGGDDIVPNYGKYFILVSPKYIESSVIAINPKEHIPYRYRPTNAIDETVYTDENNDGVADEEEIHLVPNKKRRNIYQLDKSEFLSTSWNFENNPRQSGRLYGSIVEVWDSTLTLLKQTKVITENQFNFSETSKNFECVLQPDIFGYDVNTQDINVGDVLRIFPRETAFNNLLIEVSYKNEELEVNNLISFLVNDTVRDMTTGIFEVYDENGFTIDTTGQFNGTVVNRYQIFQKDKFEARKRLKN